ncbi:MAG: hypothetical protein RIB71_18270 [Imperialibacter sp.]|uniref:hypothetical protein n=1 Tax=Imperialibacter sp. TaxID=2038411 RepID=UPI0032EFA06B
MISKVYGPVFCLILSVLLLAIVPQSHARQPSVPPQEGDTLDNITISEDEARNIIKGLFDLPRLTHSLALGRIAKDERLTAFTDGFMQRNNIQVLTIGYIDSDEFWPRIFKQQRLGKINKADADNPLAAKIIFVPASTEGPPTGYTTRLELTGKTSQVYELLSISQAEVDSIAASTSQQQLGNTTFATPNEAKETVLSALIAALQRVELKASPQDAVALVTFQAAPPDDTGLPTYGFDQMVYEQLGADYPTATIAGQTVRTAWKSLKSNAPDKVIAVAGGDASPVFEMNGVALTATPGNANTYKVSLMGASDGTTSEVLALTSADNGLTMGLLNTISYDEEHTSVKIVPVNGAGGGITQAVLRDALNEIYASVIATWDVEVLPGVQLGMAWDEDGDGKLNDGETGMLSNYTGEMNAMIAEFRKAHDREKDTYYIFLVDLPKTATKLGYMPRKKQWGFVFAGNHNNNEALTKTIAHELGHGVFHLEHTFSEKGLPQSQTTNLMDYTPTGTTLYKYQWDYVHDPVNVVTLFDDDEEGAMGVISNSTNTKALLDSIRSYNKKKIDKLISSDFIKDKKYVYTGIIIIDSVEIDLLIEHWYYSGRHEINPKQNYHFRHPTMPKRVIFEFDGTVSSGDIKPLLKIHAPATNEKKLEEYLFGDDTLRVNIVTTLIAENQKNTFSSFSIDNEQVTGFFIEREPGTVTQERTEGSGKRVPENEYVVEENNCATGRANCLNEFTLITTPAKSGTRDGILIHTGTDFSDITGCLLPVGDSYVVEANQYYIGGQMVTLDIYKSNGTSGTKLTAINTYIEEKKTQASDEKKVLKILIDINR